MAKARTRKIALVFPRRGEYSARVTEGIAAYSADRRDLRIRDFSIVREGDVPENLVPWQPDGVLCYLGLRSRSALDLLINLNVPVVNLSADYALDEVYSVHADPDSIGRLAIDHFRAGGMDRLAFVGLEKRLGAVNRWKSFKKQALASGWPEPSFHALSYEPDDDRDRAAADPAFVKWIRKLPENTGIMCLDDETGNVVCQAASRCKRPIPGDLAVLGVDDSRLCAFTDPPLTSLHLPAAEIGAAGASMLEELLGGHPPEERVRRIAVRKITLRASTRTAPVAHDDFDMLRILKIIEEKAVDGLNVEGLLADVPCSRVTFEKRFRAATGSTPGEAIRRAKLARAEALLRQTDLTSTRIAMMCGYDNLSNFCNRFRSVHGETPQSFRKRYRGT